jgi:DNA polymerase-3 subunit epsilon
MSLFDGVFGSVFGEAPRLTPEQRRRLDAWWGLDNPDLDSGHPLLRYVAVDVESTGLSILSDHLIAIGAVAVSNSRISYDCSFYSVLRQDQASSDDNILVHGIGGTSQTEGRDPVEVLLDFLAFIGTAPLVGFHTAFDEAMIRKAIRRYLGDKFDRQWLDLGWLAPAILPEYARKFRSLDDWTEAFGILNLRRHDALADALATAQLFQVLQPRASERGMRSARDLLEAARSQEWLTKQRR